MNRPILHRWRLEGMAKSAVATHARINQSDVGASLLAKNEQATRASW